MAGRDRPRQGPAEQGRAAHRRGRPRRAARPSPARRSRAGSSRSASSASPSSASSPLPMRPSASTGSSPTLLASRRHGPRHRGRRRARHRHGPLALFTIVFAELVPEDARAGQCGAVRARVRAARSTSSAGSSPVIAAADRGHAAGSPGMLRRRRDEPRPRSRAEELRLIVERGGEQGILEAEEEQMIDAVIELGDRRVHEVMVPRIAIAALPVDRVVRRGDRHDRRGGPLPRCRSTRRPIDEIVGILYAKDLLPFLKDAPTRGRRCARCSGRRSSCPSRCRSTTCSTSSSAGRSTSRSSSTSTAGRPAWSRSRTCSRRSSARSRTSTTSRSRWSCALRGRGARRRPGLDRRAGGAVRHRARARGRGRVRHGRRAGLPPDRRDPGAGRPGRASDGLTLTVESTDGRRVGKILASSRDDRTGEDGDAGATDDGGSLAAAALRVTDQIA